MIGTPRHRSEAIAAETESYSYAGFASTTIGSCTADPGPCTRPISAWNGSGSFQNKLHTREMDDFVTKGFKKLSNQGKIVNNAMTKSDYDLTSSKASFHWEYHLSKWGCSPARYYNYGDYQQTGTKPLSLLLGANEWITLPPLDVESEKSIAITAAFANIGNDKMLALTTLAELDKSLVGLAYLFKKVYSIQRYVRKMELKKLKKELTARELVEIYMNARYNLRPLYYDTTGIVNVITNKSSPPGRRTFRSKKVKVEIDSDSVQVVIYSDPYVALKCDAFRSYKRSTIVRAGVLTQASQPSYAELLGADKIVESLWDLLPFSFIIDWFVNVGSTLSAWSPTIGFKTLTSWVTVETTTDLSTYLGNYDMSYQDYSVYHHDTAPSWSISNGYSTLRTTEFCRIPDYERPLLPSWNLRMSAFKLLDLAIITKKIWKGSQINKVYR